MPDQPPQRVASPHRSFTLHFDNEEPFHAAAVGRLLSALATDYRRFTRRSQLAILRVETGSLTLVLTAVGAVVATAAGANTFYTFAKNVREVIANAKRGRFFDSGDAPSKVTKSAQAILEAAVASRSRLRLEYNSPDGEELRLELDAAELVTAHNTLSEARAHRAEQSDLLTPPRRDVLRQTLSSQLDAFAAGRLLASPEAREREDRALIVAIGLFVEALRASGSHHAVDEVAQQLVARGLHDVAAMVREELGKEGGATSRVTT